MRIVETSDFKPTLSECFKSDPELLSKWHIAAGSGLDGCVDRTFQDMKSFDKSFKFYAMYDQDRLFGYFGKEVIGRAKFMTGFFVMPEFRNKSGFSRFWDTVNTSFDGSPFGVGIHAKNTRAANFLKKSGGVLVEDIKDGDFHGQYYIFNVRM